MLNVSEVNAERSSETLPERASARFSEMLISPYMKERLAAARFTTPTPVQAAAIPQALEGKDVLATAQTGTGKTLAFLIPVIERLLKDKTPGIAALVLVPTRELAMQVVDQFNKLRGNQLLPAALVVGGLAEGGQLQAIRKGARLVVATPGRLEDYLDRRLFHFNALRMLILDEADRMLDMGFLPAIRRIVSILPKERQTMCFSATMEGDMARVVKDYLRNAVRLSFGSTSKPSENVRIQAFEVAMDRKQEMLQRLLAKETGKCLVFARTKRGTERIAESLNRRGFSAGMIHGDRSQSQRFSRAASACWWLRTWLRAGFTCRTSRTSSTTICRKWRRISSTASGEPDAMADTAWLPRSSSKSSGPSCSSWSVRSASRWSACARMKRLGFPRNRNGCQSICLVLNPFSGLEDSFFPAKFSRRSSKTRQV